MADAERLLRWFESLASRTLDLVGDYAGHELFIIERDSLFLQCFSDENLDFSHGLELLHVTYLVEKLLAQLHQRKCVFHIVFFSDHAQVCVPPNAYESMWSKYRLAREAIIQHLVQILPVTIPSIQVQRFVSYRCGDFEKYLRSVGAYFLMCHNGSSPVLGKAQDFTELPEDSDMSPLDDGHLHLSDCMEYSDRAPPRIWPTKILLRQMIHWFIHHGYNISILNSLECRDSKIISIVLEGSVSRAKQLREGGASISEFLDETSLSSPNIDDDDIPGIGSLCLEHDKAVLKSTAATQGRAMLSPTDVDRRETMEQQIIYKVSVITKQQDLELTKREWVTVKTLRMMPQSSLSHQGLLEAYAMLLHTAILGECKLEERAMVQKWSPIGELFLEGYANAMVKVLTSELWHDIIRQIPCSCDLGDAIDGSLFLEILKVLTQTHSIRSFSSPTLKKSEVLKLAVSFLFDINIRSVAAGPDDLEESCSTTSNSRSAGLLAKLDKKHIGVLEFNNAIIDAHLKPVSVVIGDSADEFISSNMSRIFQELSHWHNHKRLLNTRLNPQVTEWQKMLINRRNQRFMTDVTRYATSLTNSVGGSLEPEPMFVKHRKDKLPKQIKQSKGKDQARATKSEVDRGRPSSSRPKKHGQHVKPPVRDTIATQQQLKQTEAIERLFSAWKTMVQSFNREIDYSVRYIKVKQVGLGDWWYGRQDPKIGMSGYKERS